MSNEVLTEEVAVRPYFYGDFYPLVSFSLATDAWAAWQFDRPDLGEGMVLALRRQKSPFPRLEARLAGLDPDGRYEWRSLDKELLWPNEPPDGGGGEKAAAGPRAMEG